MTSVRDPRQPGDAQTASRVLPLNRVAARAQRRHNVPHQTTRFIGRAAELEQLRHWPTTTRLLTLAGVGGVGKTRLGLELARAAIDDFPDGVWLVELAPLDQPALAPQAIAHALDVHVPADRPLPEALAAAIGQRRMLLMLDNCEHLIDACAQLVDDLLRACPGLAVLATSREPLGIDGETVWRAQGLTLPTGPSLTEAASAEAVALFLDRARARRPGLCLTRENVDAVVQICRRLDGLPLALELAAARVDVLAPDEIAARLDARFELLTGGSRVALPRHRTLCALVDWSHALLSPQEQAVFRRLSVFAGGWMLDAAEAVALDTPTRGMNAAAGAEQPATGTRDTPGGALEPLARLTARSLVQADQHQGRTRYRLLETMRAYGLHALEASGEATQVRQRHAEHYLTLLERPRAHLASDSLRLDLDHQEREHDNFRAALAWFRDHGPAEAGLRLSAGLWWFWSVRGYLSEGRRWLQTFLDHPSVASETVERARALFGAGVLARLQGDLTAAHTLQQEALNVARIIADDPGAALALTELADVADSRGAFCEARALMEASLTIWRRLDNGREIAGTLARLARIALRQGDLPVVAPLLQESRQLAEALGATDVLAACSYYLGELASASGDDEAAGRHYRQSLRLFQEQGYQRWIARALEGLASLEATRAPARALRLAGAAARLRQVSGQPLSPSERERLAARLAPAHRALGHHAPGQDIVCDCASAETPSSTAPSVEDVIAEALASPALRPAAQPPLDRPSAIQSAVSLGPPDVDGPARRPPDRATGQLTRREREVIKLLARGYSNPQISAELVVSRRTVEAHVTAILSKLGLSSRTQVAIWAVEHGMHAQPQP